MLSREEIKTIRSLNLKKYRNKSGRFLAEGDKVVKALIDSTIHFTGIYALPDWIDNNHALLSPHMDKVTPVNEYLLGRISQMKTPNQVVAVGSIPPQKQIAPEIFRDWVLALDDIRDPGNFGTILRTADWYGITWIICSNHCADLYNPKVIQAAMGSAFTINVLYRDLQEVLTEIPDSHKVYGATLAGTDVHKVSVPSSGILIIGNESKGISESLKRSIHKEISIPPYGKAESLNAAIATAVMLDVIRNR